MRALLRIGALLLVFSGLAACSTKPANNASPEEIAAAAYVPGGTPSLTLVTVVNNRTGAGGHSALIVKGSQQVIFDPAGSFKHDDVKERGDVLYGISPAWVAGYKSAHARDSHHVVTQEINLSAAQAETALQLVQSYGAVPDAFCANATSSVLRQVPGFESVSTTFYPVKLMEQIDAYPGVKTERYYENDAGDVLDGINPVDT